VSPTLSFFFGTFFFFIQPKLSFPWIFRSHPFNSFPLELGILSPFLVPRPVGFSWGRAGFAGCLCLPPVLFLLTLTRRVLFFLFRSLLFFFFFTWAVFIYAVFCTHSIPLVFFFLVSSGLRLRRFPFDGHLPQAPAIVVFLFFFFFL